MTKGIDVLRKYVGLQEVDDRKEIMDLLASQSHHGDISIDPSVTAWCAATINFCERSVGNPGNGHLNARSFLTYGEPVELADAKTGDIIVFDFEHDGIHGHVTYFVELVQKMSGTYISCLGGNQGNEIQESNYNVNNIVGIRRYGV